MTKKDFHTRYQRLLEQQASEALDEVWNNISAQLDTDADALKMAPEENDIIDEVWSGIENELDIDEVWGSISSELDGNNKIAFLPRVRYWMGAAIVLLIIGLMAVMQFFLEQVTQPSAISLRHSEESVQQNTVVVEDSVDIELRESDTGVLTKNRLAEDMLNVRVKNQQTILLRNEPDAIKSAVQFPNEESNTNTHSPMFASGFFLENETNELLQGKQAFISNPHRFELQQAIVLPKNTSVKHGWIESLKPIEEAGYSNELPYDRKDSRWTTGVVTALKNTYLLNAETIEGFSPHGMNSSKITLQPDVGLSVQYAINKQFIVCSNLFLSSSSKQNSDVYNYGEYVQKETQLDYLSTELALKHTARHSFFGDKIIRRNIGGVYLASLQSGTETISQISEDAAFKYTSFDYGLVLGQEFELRNRGPLKVTSGLMVKYGLPNVYVGDESYPGKFNKTHNASIEFRIGIAYRWKAKVGIDHYLGVRSKRTR